MIKKLGYKLRAIKLLVFFMIRVKFNLMIDSFYVQIHIRLQVGRGKKTYFFCS